MRKTLDMQLSALCAQLTQMGGLCQKAIAQAALALKTGDTAMADEAIAADGEIDQMERDIEALCLKMLLQQQPVARDLRQISSALKMITDMERIGDQAADISEIVTLVANDPPPLELSHIGAMAQATCEMVDLSVEAYVRQDLTLARAVVADDDRVDRLFDDVKGELIELIAASPHLGEAALDLLMIAKYLERIGDHAVNIAEWVEFSILGHHPDQSVDIPVEHQPGPGQP